MVVRSVVARFAALTTTRNLVGEECIVGVGSGHAVTRSAFGHTKLTGYFGNSYRNTLFSSTLEEAARLKLSPSGGDCKQ